MNIVNTTVEYHSFKAKTSRQEIYNTVNTISVNCSRDHSSLSSIRWKEVCLNSYDEAREYLKENERGYYEQVAVKYKGGEFVPSVGVVNLKNRLDALEEVYHSLCKGFYFQDFKKTSVICKNCGSRITVAYLKGNHCPVCKVDLRPKKVLSEIKSLEQKAVRLKELYESKKQTEFKRFLLKAEEFWLVKIEYPT